MLLLIDNYDSFTYNLYQQISTIYRDIEVYRNDELNVSDIEELNPEAVIISPGPGRPESAGVSLDAVKYSQNSKTPLLGVCLGHQVIVHVFGGKVIEGKPFHGKTDLIFHNGRSIFSGLKNPFVATRYHSLVVEKKIPDVLKVTSRNAEKIIMSVSHRELPIYGVQFHPESFLTEEGYKLINNFLKVVFDNAGNYSGSTV